MTTATRIGIHDLSVATGTYSLDLDLLAARVGVDPAKYSVGLGQREFSVLAPDEDVVTLGAAAALPILERHGTDGIRTLLFATESGIDQSKSAAVFAHGLLGLPSAVRAVELKQACYAGAAALQTALGIVARDPRERVLVIASDVARYDVDTAAEPTQGAGAVAFLVTADPALVEIEPVSGVFSADVDDFWRPNDRSTALVDGRLSVSAYMDALLGAWEDHQGRGGPSFDEIDRFCHHQPFIKMAIKAHQKLAAHTGAEYDASAIETGFRYNRRMGNSYTASLFLALAALLDADDDLVGRRIGFFSYGSGSVGEFFTGVVQPEYLAARRSGRVDGILDAREPVDVDRYRELHAHSESGSEADTETTRVGRGPVRFVGVRGGARRYERVG